MRPQNRNHKNVNLPRGVVLAVLFLVSPAILQAQKHSERIAVTPTLGNYSATQVLIGSSTVKTPSAAPTNAARTTARASSGFKGVLTIDPANGNLRITNAMPAGVHTITITADDGAGAQATRTMTLTVLGVTAGCSPYNSNNFTRASASPFATGSEPTYPGVGDFNNDGIQDIVIANFSGNNASVLLGTGDGNFGAAANYPTGTSPEYLTVNDFNGDGNADFVVANVNSGNINIYLGNGAGGFSQAPGSPVGTGSFPRFVVAEDFDRDGTVDLAVANEMSSNVVILLGNGNGGFTGGVTLSAGGRTSGLVKGDFNDDGFIDLAVNTFSSTLVLFLGNGAGSFGSGTATGLPGFSNFLASGDFNQDSFLDLLADNDGGANIPGLLNNGTGTFSAFSPSIPSRTFGLSVADLNGDGNDDFLVSPSFGSTVIVQLSNGDGTFTNVGSVTGFDTATGHAIGDFNGDNRLDFAVAEFNRFSSVLGCVFRITTPSLHQGRAGVFYTQNIAVQGGTPSYTFSATGLPLGLSIDPSSGVISGTPSQFGTFNPIVTVTDSTAFAYAGKEISFAPEANRVTSRTYQLILAAPTASGVSLGGRVLTSDGRGLINATVTLTDTFGQTPYARTGSFGFYHFDGLTAGQGYVVSVSSKRYAFAPRFITVNENLSDEDFTPEPDQRMRVTNGRSDPRRTQRILH